VPLSLKEVSLDDNISLRERSWQFGRVYLKHRNGSVWSLTAVSKLPAPLRHHSLELSSSFVSRLNCDLLYVVFS
jgi:hypothetical protein